MGLGEKKQTVMQYNSQGLPLRSALPIAGISKHQYYYRQKEGKPGIKPSAQTIFLHNGQEQKHTDQQVVQHIEQIHQDPDLRYGYHTMTRFLQQQGYQINHKKVYRLMKENALLQPKTKRSAKTYVQYRKVMPVRPPCCR